MNDAHHGPYAVCYWCCVLLPVGIIPSDLPLKACHISETESDAFQIGSQYARPSPTPNMPSRQSSQHTHPDDAAYYTPYTKPHLLQLVGVPSDEGDGLRVHTFSLSSAPHGTTDLHGGVITGERGCSGDGYVDRAEGAA